MGCAPDRSEANSAKRSAEGASALEVKRLFVGVLLPEGKPTTASRRSGPDRKGAMIA
jgi:hypothetical protein